MIYFNFEGNINLNELKVWMGELLGIANISSGKRMYSKGGIWVWPEELERGKDLYLLLMSSVHTSNNDKPDILFQNRPIIVKISLENQNKINSDPGIIYKPQEKDSNSPTHKFPHDMVDVVWCAGQWVIDKNLAEFLSTKKEPKQQPPKTDKSKADKFANAVADKLIDKIGLNAQDIIAAILRVPYSDKDWVNLQIREANKLHGIPTPGRRHNDKTHRSTRPEE